MIKRKQYLINKKIQHRYTVELIVFVAVVISVMVVDMLILQRAGISSVITATNPIGTLELVYLVFSREWMLLIPMYAWTFFLVYCVPIYYSHRFVGPIHKSTATLKAMAKGVLVNDIHFRKKDFFKELEQALNQTTSAYRQTFKDLKNATDNIKQKADSLGDAELSADVEVLEKILSRYQEEEKEQYRAGEKQSFQTPVINTDKIT